jgi:hypothetical protein
MELLVDELELDSLVELDDDDDDRLVELLELD